MLTGSSASWYEAIVPLTFADLRSVRRNSWLESSHSTICGLHCSASWRLPLLPSLSQAQGVPVFEVNHADSTIKFSVKASVAIAGTFDKWDAGMTLTSPDLSTAVLDIKIQADSVNTGSGMKDGKLKGKDFFDAKEDPLITFHSTKVVQISSDTVEFDGDFTIRGATQTRKADVYGHRQGHRVR